MTYLSRKISLYSQGLQQKTLKGSPIEKEDIYDYYSPINWISHRMVPCLIAHGKMDTTVPFKSSVKFVKALKEHEVKYTFLVHRKGGHSFDTKLKDIGTVNTLERTVRFIKNNIFIKLVYYDYYKDRTTKK